jgi:hypothetical protein
LLAVSFEKARFMALKTVANSSLYPPSLVLVARKPVGTSAVSYIVELEKRGTTVSMEREARHLVD